MSFLAHKALYKNTFDEKHALHFSAGALLPIALYLLFQPFAAPEGTPQGIPPEPSNGTHFSICRGARLRGARLSWLGFGGHFGKGEVRR